MQVRRVCACAGRIQLNPGQDLPASLFPGQGSEGLFSVITSCCCSSSMCTREQSSAAVAPFILAVPKQFLCSLSTGAMYVCRINKQISGFLPSLCLGARTAFRSLYLGLCSGQNCCLGFWQRFLSTPFQIKLQVPHS